ncbi:MAG: hypothetical protein KME12_21675 [Trichocoleus desertorum ATA4-8-CV12]|jgi:hypothetical protein|nr:hypothetical protein [Trichocoleus desertorum ATA4-8-CV12]
MSDSVLDRIRKNRTKAAVPPRSDALIAQSQQIPNAGEALEEAIASSSDTPEDDREPVLGNTLEQLRAELMKLPETRRHSAIVLEKSLDQELTRYCKDQRITVEVFLEAAWTQASTDPALMEKIVDEAKCRYKGRKEAGKLRRLITMLESKT